ncbi:hypothetical protein [Actinomadura sp. HBU206391]|uniref:hypothetical protein n=1 Tax=Actinomadura sp. HBU206391 TaxID=2731692 RepID=UPI0016505A22|nr:hypothetical protein [Actinomadura sp. HBU206391]MBC6462478.1 hypothetical protein [Actinomadura sp. HBU206391]
MTDDGVGEILAWCVVANVTDRIPHGEGGREFRRGLRHFAAGARLWVLPAQWGDGWENAIVVGRHRGSRRYVRMVVPLRHLTRFRVRAVYSPTVFRELTRPWAPRGDHPIGLWDSREHAERAAAAALRRTASDPGDAPTPPPPPED